MSCHFNLASTINTGMFNYKNVKLACQVKIHRHNEVNPISTPKKKNKN